MRRERCAVWAPKGGARGDAPIGADRSVPGMPWSSTGQREVWSSKGRFMRYRDQEAWNPVDGRRPPEQDPVAELPQVGIPGIGRDHTSQHMRRHVQHVEMLLRASAEQSCSREECEPHRTRWRSLPRAAQSSEKGLQISPHVQLQMKRLHSLLTKGGGRTGSLSDASTASSDDGGGVASPNSLDLQDCWPRPEVIASEEFRQSLAGKVPTSRAESAIVAIVLAGLPEGERDEFAEDCLSLCAPSIEQRARVDRCLSELRGIARKLGHSWRVLPFGSHVNGLALPGSDLDVTCIRVGDDPSADCNEYSAAYALHSVLQPLLQRHPSFRVTSQVLKARVPLLKLRFEQQLDVDFSWNNSKPLQNTRLLQTYVGLGASVRDLIMAVKLWAHAADVCGASQSKLSTYSFTLMAIYFLQVDPEVRMPCLPTPNGEDLTSQETELYAGSLEFDSSWSCPLPLPVLLARFFRFYGEQFAWGNEVVSVRVGKRIDSLSKEYALLPYRDQQRIHIEDPCEPKRNLHCVLGADEEFGLRQAFAEAVRIIWKIRLPFYFRSIETRTALPDIVRSSTTTHDQRGSRMPREARPEGQPRRRWPSLKTTSLLENDHQIDESQAHVEGAKALKKNDDACYWFALVASAYLYTLYASISGNLFRLTLALGSLCLVFVEKRKRNGLAAKASQAAPAEDSTRQGRPRSQSIRGLGRDQGN
mmetsp:Transcript_145601/g.265086  ORF Transcript_145601/g.265086 Transcript_145601/m.265086 type:complete len:702 (-) Transcript_145601:36-2141(-)